MTAAGFSVALAAVLMASSVAAEEELGSPPAALEFLRAGEGESLPSCVHACGLPEYRTPGWNGSIINFVLRGLFVAYRTLLSSQDSAACAFTPSCSGFSQRAINECGLAVGMLATADRLMRCNHWPAPYYVKDPSSGRWRDDVSRYCGTGAR